MNTLQGWSDHVQACGDLNAAIARSMTDRKGLGEGEGEAGE